MAAKIVPEMPKIDHYYSMKDGYEYGYEQAISQDAADSGQVATSLLMFKFVGEKDGNYQVFSKNAGDVITLLQCSNPCEYIKVMTFLGNEHLTTERVKAVEGSIGWSVLSDAINGKLEKYIANKNDKKFTIWFDEKVGSKIRDIVQ